MRNTSGLTKEKHRGREIVFNESKYDDFMLNIHKRKVERKTQGHFAQKEKEKEAIRESRKEKRKDIKRTIIEQFGDVTIDDDGSMVTKDELERRKARGNMVVEDEEDDGSALRFEDDKACVFVETTDMAGKQQKIKVVKRTAVVDEEEEEESEEEELSSDSENESEIAKRNARMASKMKRQRELMESDDDDVVITYGDDNNDDDEGEDEDDDEENDNDDDNDDDDDDDIIVHSSNPNKTKLNKKPVVAEVAPQKKKKEKKVNAITALWNEDAELPKSTAAVEPATKKPKKDSKSMTKEQSMYADLMASAVDRSGGVMELVRVNTANMIGPARPSVEDILMSTLPLPAHWEAEKYQRAAMEEAMAIEKKAAADKKRGMKEDQLYALKYDASYGWEEGDGSKEKDLGLINGLGPASMGGRNRKKPLSKKNSKSHNARKERAETKRKDKEDQEVRRAWENEESSGHGFGYESDGDDDNAMLGKHNKQRKRTEARKKAVARVAKTEKTEGWSNGQRVGKKSYYFGSRDGAINM